MHDFTSQILIFCTSRSWGGMEIMALENAKQLQKHGFNTAIVCAENTPLYKNSINSGIKVFYGFKNTNKLSSIKKFAGLIKNNNIKVIHSHFSNDLWIIVPALKLSKCKASLYLTKHLASGVVKKDILHKFLYKRVDKIFAISGFIRKNVIATCPVPAEKVVLLPNGIDLNVFTGSLYNGKKFRDEFNIPPGKIVISLVGRITPGKGHKEFIEAVSIINREEPDKTVFVITGSSAKGEEKFEEEIKQLAKVNNTGNIIFTGYRSDVADILAGTDILAFPSHEESFGITLLEAMAMEVPVIAGSNAGVTDIIPSEEFGLLIPTKNSNALAGAMMKLINNAELRKKLALNGKKRIIENFDIEKIMKDLEKYYAIS